MLYSFNEWKIHVFLNKFCVTQPVSTPKVTSGHFLSSLISQQGGWCVAACIRAHHSMKKAVMILPVVVHDGDDERHILNVLVGDIKDQRLIICGIEGILLYGRLSLFQPSTFTNQRCLYVGIWESKNRQSEGERKFVNSRTQCFDGIKINANNGINNNCASNNDTLALLFHNALWAQHNHVLWEEPLLHYFKPCCDN